MKYLREPNEPTRYLRPSWVMQTGTQRGTLTPRYDPAERKLVVTTPDLALIEALYRERFQR